MQGLASAFKLTEERRDVVVVRVAQVDVLLSAHETGIPDVVPVLHPADISVSS